MTKIAQKPVGCQAGNLLKRHHGLTISGFHHGHFAHEGKENDTVIEKINTCLPDILLVGLGTPVQEQWIDRNQSKLAAPVVWAVGAVMDFIAGAVPRAPRWMREHGLEWLFRLWLEPGRMWKRYILGNPLFILRVFKEWLAGPGQGNIPEER